MVDVKTEVRQYGCIGVPYLKLSFPFGHRFLYLPVDKQDGHPKSQIVNDLAFLIAEVIEAINRKCSFKIASSQKKNYMVTPDHELNIGNIFLN